MSVESNEPRSAQSGWEVTRFVPIPTSVSAKAQDFLGMGLGMGGAELTEVSRTDIDGWKSQIATVNELMVAMFDAVPPTPSSTVEATTIAEVPVFVLRPDDARDDPEGPIYFDIHGGGLVFGAGEACRAMMPAALVLLTPEIDLTESGDSFAG